MGVIALALFESGHISHFYIPTWVIVTAGLAIGAGTYAGGWRIMRTLGQRVIRMEPASGFAAQTTAGLTIYARNEARLPALHHSCHLRLGLGAGATQAALRCSVGRRGQHRPCVAADHPGSALVAAALYWPVEAIF